MTRGKYFNNKSETIEVFVRFVGHVYSKDVETSVHNGDIDTSFQGVMKVNRSNIGIDRLVPQQCNSTMFAVIAPKL